jgi:GTP-binding protein Era
MSAPDFKSGYVAIVGEPNVGKSTLLNALVGQKLSIVSRKPQTTRQRLLAIASTADHQIIFLDTPGLLEPRYQLHQYMVREIEQSLADADLVLLMVDAQRPETPDPALVKKLLAGHGPVFVIINKIDLVDKIRLLPVIDHWLKALNPAEIIPISALTIDGVALVRTAIVRALPVGPPFYPIDEVSEQPERFFVAELVREAIFEKMKKEIPYSCAVLVDPFITRGKKTYVKASIFVERPTQKGILIGSGGANLKMLGTLARTKIEEFLGYSVFLELWVGVKTDWKTDPKALEELGYHHGPN